MPVEALRWHAGALVILDQTRLPGAVVHRRIDTLDELCEAIRSLLVRGAPALGVAAAYGLPAGMNDLAPDFADYVGAAFVNDRGEVACEIDMGVPCLWLPAPAYGFPAGFSILPMDQQHLAAFFPSSISEAGQIAGQVYIVKSDVTRDYEMAAAVWRAGQYRVLNEMLPPGSPWNLRDATAIVRVGKTTLVTGHGIRSDVTDINGFPASHGFVLSVTCTGDLDEDGDVDADDQAILMSSFGEDVPAGTSGDLDGDGDVDETDIRLLARQIERPCL